MRKIKEMPCPFCGELPTIDSYEDDVYSRVKKTYGRKLTAIVKHWCKVCNPNKKISVQGSSTILWGNFNKDIVYEPADFYNTEDVALDSVARKWNALVKKLAKGKL